VEIGKAEGAKVLTGGERAGLGGELSGGYYARPTVFEGSSSMRIFQEEIFGPVLALTSFADEADALKIANDSLHGLGAGVWTTDGARAYRAGRETRGAGSGPTAPRLPGPRRLRRLQAVRRRPGEPNDDARPLPAGQEPHGQLLPEEARLLLGRRVSTITRTRRRPV
jgi:hypothetical protein